MNPLLWRFAEVFSSNVLQFSWRPLVKAMLLGNHSCLVLLDYKLHEEVGRQDWKWSFTLDLGLPWVLGQGGWMLLHWNLGATNDFWEQSFVSFVLHGAWVTETWKIVAGLPWWLRQWRICPQCRRLGFDPWLGQSPGEGNGCSTPVFLPGESRGQRSLVGYTVHGVAKSQTPLND